MRPRCRVAVLTAALLIGQGALALPATASEHSRVEVVVAGLDNPRGIDVGPDGTVYVAEAGSGGDEHCVEREGEAGEVIEMCLGASSTVTAVAADGTIATVVDGLPSVMAGEGEFAGASDVEVADDGSLYISIALGGDAELRDEIAAAWEPGGLLGTVQHFADDELTEVADLAQWEADNDPDSGSPSTGGPQGQPSNDSNPNGLLLTSDGVLLAVDAGGNSALSIDIETGDITLGALFEDRMVEAPAFLGAPPGTELPMQAVPTNLAEGPDGDIVVGQLTGFPFPVGGARVYELDETTTPQILHDGFTNIMDVVYVDGDLYVLQLAWNGLLAGPGEGALVRVNEDGSRSVLLRDVLMAPGGIAADADGMLYITNGSIGEPGSGSVIRFDPSMATDENIQSACPPLEVAGSSLSDVLGTTHEEAIACVTWHGLFSGYGDGTFGPGDDITRGQFATTVAGLIRATGAELPVGADGQFSDVDGTTHGAAINDLSDAGLVSGFGDGTFGPATSISRAQAVSILVAAYEFVVGEDIEPGPLVFADVSGTHEANINAATAMGWLQGTSATTFSPEANISRGQVASPLARMASDLVDGEYLELPA